MEAYHFVRLICRAQGKRIKLNAVSVREQTQTKIFDFAEHLNRRVSVNKIRARFYKNILSLLLKKDPSTNVKN